MSGMGDPVGADGDTHIMLLHSVFCGATESEAEQMMSRLQLDPEALERPYFVDANCPDPIFALHDACKQGHVVCVRRLLEAGARPDLLDVRSYTATMYAVSSRNDPMERAAIVGLLLSYGAEPNYPRLARSRTRYLETAISNSLIVAARVLLEHGAMTEDLVVNSEGGKSLRTNFDPPVIVAIQRRNNEALNLLLLHDAALEFCNFWDEKIVVLFKILEHYKSADDAEKAVTIYSQYGGNLWIEHEGQNALQALKCQNSQYYFKSGDRAKLEDTLQFLMWNPNTLQGASRLAIRKAVGGKLWCQAHNLPVPPQIKSYLMFS